MIALANCPLLWVSKLQTEFSLSNIHSESVALPHSIRDLINLESIINKVIGNLVIDSKNIEFLSSSTFYKDNNSAIVVAKTPRMTTASNHIDFEYHWF